jgi:uncharacterized protein
MHCHCASTLCRGVVTANDWQLPVLQERYAGHFSPFINARIATRNGSPPEASHQTTKPT